MGMTLSPHTQGLDPQGGSLATRGYDPATSLFSISVCLAFWMCVCICVCSWSLHAWLCACERTSTHLMHESRLLKLLMLKEHYTHVIKSLQQARLAP